MILGEPSCKPSRSLVVKYVWHTPFKADFPVLAPEKEPIPESRQVKAVQVHHLVPCRHKIPDEFFSGI